MSRVMCIRHNGRVFVDLVDVELFLRRALEANPTLTKEVLVDHMVKELGSLVQQ